MKLKRLTLSNYKSFRSFVLPLRGDTFLVGPNNAGKSTLIEAIRVCAAMARLAGRHRPSIIGEVNGRQHWAYPINEESLGLTVENLRYRFHGEEARLRLALDIGVRINAVWPALDETGAPSDRPFFYVEKVGEEGFSGIRPSTLKLPGTIGVIPTLSPIPDREEMIGRDYTDRFAGTPRTSLHLRNLIYQIQQDGQFDEFRDWVLAELSELDDLSIKRRPGEHVGRYELDVFFKEDRDNTIREICWAGDGLQIYLQILVHLWRNKSASVVVLDEPDVFLHADLQRRLVRLLEGRPHQTITATHSVEMLAEASEDTVVWVDKSRPRAISRPAPGGPEDLSSQIGSHFNLRLAGALKAKVVLFVEGNDMSILRRIAATVGADRLSTESKCAVVAMQGYSNWSHIEPFHWFAKKFLKDSITVFVILDRDYRTDFQVSLVTQKLNTIGVSCHVWKRKELESYLLEEGALSRLTGIDVDLVNQLIDEACLEILPTCRGQFLAEYQRDLPSNLSLGTAIQRALDHFSQPFADLQWLRQRLPAKELMSKFNRRVQEIGADPVTAQRLARELTPTEISSEMKGLLHRVETALTRTM